LIDAIIEKIADEIAQKPFRHNVQFLRYPFQQNKWHRQLLNSACDSIDGRIFNVTEFWPDSPLLKVGCRIRRLNSFELKQNGRPFADRTHQILEFSVLDFDLSKSWEFLSSNNEFKNDDKIEEILRWSPIINAETFSNIIIFLINLTFCRVFGTESWTATIGEDYKNHGTLSVIHLNQDDDSFPFLESGISQKLDFDTVLNWSKSCKGIWDEQAISPVEKSISFLSHAFYDTNYRGGIASLI
jgi:hypothetical protein